MTTITQEHAKLDAVAGGPKLRRRSQWGSSFNYSGARSVTEPATRVFIHISVTNVENYNSNDAHARALEAIGRSRFPSTGVSYNRACMHDGTLYELQPIGRRGAHTVNDFRRSTCSTSGCPGRGSSLTAPDWNLNYNSRAYVIAQNTQHTVTDKMVDQLARAIVADYRAGFITKAAAENPHGHRCVSSKSCPGNAMWARMGTLASKIKSYIQNGLGEKEWWEMAIPSSELDKIENRMKEAVEAVLRKPLVPRYDYTTGKDAKDRAAVTTMLHYTHENLVKLRRDDIDKLAPSIAAAVVALLPEGSPDLAEVETAVRNVLQEGVGE